MHISLTPELEARVKQKVASGLYNNASEVIREALRFMILNEEIVYEWKLERLKEILRPGIEQAERGECEEGDIDQFLKEARERRAERKDGHARNGVK